MVEVENEEKNPIGRGTFIFFTIWHLFLFFLLFLSLFLPWFDEANLFEYSYFICPTNPFGINCPAITTIYLIAEFGLFFGLSIFFNITSLSNLNLERSRRRLDFALSFFIPIPFGIIVGALTLGGLAFSTTLGVGYYLFGTIFGSIYSIIALIELIFLIWGYVKGYFPKREKSKDPFDQMF